MKLRELGAAVVEPVRNLLIDASPIKLASEPRSDGRKELTRLRDRWRELRDPLTAYAAAHPSSDLTKATLQLRDAVEISIASTSWVLDVSPEALESEEKAMAIAREAHQEAVEMIYRVRGLVRGDQYFPSANTLNAELHGHHSRPQ